MSNVLLIISRSEKWLFVYIDLVVMGNGDDV